MCDIEGRYPDIVKIIKILEWIHYNNVSEARVFIGVCVYFHIWIRDFAIVAVAIYKLFRKDVPFR